MGRLTKKSASGRTLLSLAYDRNGNLTHQTDVTGKTTEYRYDVNDRTTQVWDNGRQMAEYSYDDAGQVKSLKNGTLVTSYAYDCDRNLTHLKITLGTEVLADNHYRYDGNGNRVEKTESAAGKSFVTSYGYDSQNRICSVHYPDRQCTNTMPFAVIQKWKHSAVISR